MHVRRQVSLRLDLIKYYQELNMCSISAQSRAYLSEEAYCAVLPPNLTHTDHLACAGLVVVVSEAIA